MVWRSSATLPAHAPSAHGASRATHLGVSLVANSPQTLWVLLIEFFLYGDGHQYYAK
jgi:hypothetical protein